MTFKLPFYIIHLMKGVFMRRYLDESFKMSICFDVFITLSLISIKFILCQVSILNVYDYRPWVPWYLVEW